MLAAIRRARTKHGKNYDTEQLPGRLVQAKVIVRAAGAISKSRAFDMAPSAVEISLFEVNCRCKTSTRTCRL